MTNTKRTLMEGTNMILVIILAVIYGLSTGAFAQQCNNIYQVGGVGNQWAPVLSNVAYYAEWASSITFRSGDCIQFNRITNGYIYLILRSDYTTCFIATSNSYNYKMWYYYGPAYQPLVEGPIAVYQEYPVYYYLVEANYIDCTEGMKFVITVVGPSTSTQTPPTPPTPSSNSTQPSPTLTPPSPTPTPPKSLFTSPSTTKSSGSLSSGQIVAIVFGILGAILTAGIAIRCCHHISCCNFRWEN